MKILNQLLSQLPLREIKYSVIFFLCVAALAYFSFSPCAENKYESLFHNLAKEVLGFKLVCRVDENYIQEIPLPFMIAQWNDHSLLNFISNCFCQPFILPI